MLNRKCLFFKGVIVFNFIHYFLSNVREEVKKGEKTLVNLPSIRKEIALYQMQFDKEQNLCKAIGLARLKGFEPQTPALGGQCSIQLSYKRKY